MLKDDETFKELFDPDEIAAVNTSSKLPYYNTFTWTQDIYALDKARVPKEIQDLLKHFKVLKEERLERIKAALPTIHNMSNDNSSAAGSKVDLKNDSRQKLVLPIELYSKKRFDLSILKGQDSLKEDGNDSKKILRSLPRKITKNGKRDKIGPRERLQNGFESIDNLVKSNSSASMVKSCVTDLVKKVKNKRLLNPERYLKESEHLFDTSTILSKGVLRRTQDLQQRISSSYTRLNPSKTSLHNLIPEATVGVIGGMVRSSYRTPSPEPTKKVMLNKLKGIMKAQRKLYITKGHAVPFSLLHTLTPQAARSTVSRK